MAKWTGEWYYDCWLYPPWHGMHDEEEVEAYDENQAREKIEWLGRQALERRGCPPMIITHHLHVRSVKEKPKSIW